jgi:glycosyltransferase involved in cell wall biosynthesis
VQLITEGTYPFQEGGVSTWCDALIRNLPEVSFVVVGITGAPATVPTEGLPPNLTDVITLPLWGTLGVGEAQRGLGWGRAFKLRRGAKRAATRERFAALFADLLTDLLAETASLRRLGFTLRDLARLFSANDYDTLMGDQSAWRIFSAEVARHVDAMAEPPSLLDLSDALQMLMRWLSPLAVPLPRSSIVHATAAGIASLPAIVARVEYGTPFLLTEHGVYLRERLISWIRSDASPFIQWFAMRVTRRIVELSLATADAIAPVSGWNGRWEEHLGALSTRIEPIPNGVDPQRFTPQPMPSWDTPTMTWVGRIDPLKDLLTLIEAMALVRRELPTARTLLFGKAPAGNEAYEATCRARIAELGLEDAILFKGYAPTPETAFSQGHISILSSISEALPFSAIEAMLCGRAVVGTAVGGVPEVISAGGLLVPPRCPEEMAQACLELLRNPERCEALGAEARAHAEANFALSRSVDAYSSLYRRMSGLLAQERIPAVLPRPVQGVGVFSEGAAD